MASSLLALSCTLANSLVQVGNAGVLRGVAKRMRQLGFQATGSAKRLGVHASLGAWRRVAVHVGALRAVRGG